MRSISITYLHRQGLLKASSQAFSLKWSRHGQVTGDIQITATEAGLILNYRSRAYGEEWKDHKYLVPITWTACNFGGSRPWFQCPVCKKRVGVLFSGEIFACRHCHRLAYTCQREQLYKRLQRKSIKIRDRLGWDSDMGGKPKYMRWVTFEKLRRKADHFERLSWLNLSKRFR